MASVLYSGPAAGGKTQAARRLLAAATVPTVMIDFQSLYASVLGIERDPETGRFPPRRPQDAYALPLAEYARQAIITGAIAQELEIVLTNSDGDSDRRNYLLGRLPATASEVIIDPGIQVVEQRLSVDGTLDPDCRRAIQRWYGRIPPGGVSQ